MLLSRPLAALVPLVVVVPGLLALGAFGLDHDHDAASVDEGPAWPPGSGTVAWDASDVKVSRTDTLFPGDQKRLFEPSIAIDPTDATNVLAFAIDHSTQNYDPNVWSVDRRYRSTDGGATWSDEGPTVPTTWDGGDPVVLFAPGGTAYFAELAKYVHPSERVGGILVHRSLDGGDTWQAPVVAVSRAEANGKCPSPDKEWLSQDAAGVLYLAWTDFIFDCEVLVDDPLGLFGLMSYYDASVKLTKSLDGGLTWTTPTLVHDGYALGAEPIIEPDGTLHVAYWGATTLPGLFGCPSIVGTAASVTFEEARAFASTFVSTSHDGGATWSHHEVPICSNEVSFTTKAGTFTQQIPAIATHPVTGATYVVWPQWDLTQDRITMMLMRTTDHGAGWSSPVGITPYAGEDTFLPTLHLGLDGVLRLAYVTTRAGDDTGDAAYTESLDGGVTWSYRTLLTTQTWELSGDQELGHYIEMDVSGGRIVVAWTDGRNGDWDATEIWMRGGTVSG